jgi:carboxymethylenebutenolidase
MLFMVPASERVPLTIEKPVTQIEIGQRVFDLYDEYCHDRIDRREFLMRASAIAMISPP